VNAIANIQARSVSIWIVEDNKVYRQNLTKVLLDESWISQCKAFESGELVLEEFQKETPPDVLLLDIGLPGIDGVTTLKRIKRISPSTKILILTIQEDKENVFQAISSGADGYLLKISTIESIIQSIEEVLMGGSPINSYIANKILAVFKNNTNSSSDYALTVREKEILELLVHGISRKKIASSLFLSYHTIDFHIRNIYSKLQVNSLPDAVAKTIREKII